MKLTRLAAGVAVGSLAVASLAGCSLITGEQPSDAQDSGSGSFPEAWEETITIDVFDGLANYMGVQSGWFAKIVKDKFNMELNIIAPNVAGGGDTLYNTRVSAGDLGDLIITDKGEKLDELIEGGLVLDAGGYYDRMEHAPRFDAAVDKLNEGKDGVYAFPTSVSSIPPTESSEGLEPTFGPYVRWDYYAELGYPEVGTLEDLLPILADMQAAHPTAENGQPVYGLSLFKDWDGNFMNNAKQPATFYGYDEMGFALAKADGSDYQSIIDDDSAYVRSLRFFHEANELGLVDPESTTQNYDTMFTKYQNGQVLFSFWPWLGQSAFNTPENTAEGKGFGMVNMQDQQIFSYGAEIYGGKQVLAIGADAEDPERIAAFIDWLYSTEGAYVNGSQTGAAAGPQGLTWEVGADGEPELTEFGMEALLTGEAAVPEEWGGGTYRDGVSALNVTVVLPADVDPDTGFPYSYTFWPSFQETQSNPFTEDWSSHMDGATSTMDFLETHDQILVAPGGGYTSPPDTSEIETLRNQIKAQIVQYSWQMVFARDDAEFDALLDDLQTTVEGLGYDKVLAFDMEKAEAQNDARVAVAEQFG
ncbi:MULTISPECIES: type 2 periplasmic-binding domain-containing protein [unclassified Microbacterium]|uniref:ABC transporter substrate-binding protein n=1 Tax=Microbacterium sp. JZ37 TaxID=2654193 RepID=UPI002B47C780|nr:ABC transporter substrate-binding protein [Microbacterium sp. JZ37]WRH16973.1 ABC transporter substrate-binding protein [Microbacterium sp. JZ37]